MACCGASGPGYATPKDATKGPRETLLYVPCIVPDATRPDYLATVDADPASATFSQVIHRLPMPYKGDELHHSGWNACSSCFGDPSKRRTHLVLPALLSGRVYTVDTASDPRAPKLHRVLQAEDLQEAGLGNPHTAHCLGSGDIMISTMGDAVGNARGSFVVLDQDLKIKGTWAKHDTPFGYDFWYQPRLNVMVSTGWGAPSKFSGGFDPSHVADHYDHRVYIWKLSTRELQQTIELGSEGLIPLEVRFLHEPTAPHAFVGAALSSNIIHVYRSDDSSEWQHRVLVRQQPTPVEGWALPELPPLITDILISLDDRFLYFVNWLRGDVQQWDISDPFNPRLAGQVYTGGLIRKGSPYKPIGQEPPEIPRVKGVELRGGPQMIQLSLDGKRLYATNSLFSKWDNQFYPEIIQQGGQMILIDVDNEKGGLSINPDFLIDFGNEPDGPVVAHEIRYPGGDCSSDIWE